MSRDIVYLSREHYIQIPLTTAETNLTINNYIFLLLVISKPSQIEP